MLKTGRYQHIGKDPACPELADMNDWVVVTGVDVSLHQDHFTS